MRVLWVSNSPIGPAADILNNTYNGTSGGWIQSEYEFLDKSNLVMSFLCFVPNITNEEILEKTNSIGTLYGIKPPRIQNGILPSQKLITKIQGIIDKIAPDIIQIWGTETCLSNAVSKCSPNIPKVIFIQGLLGVHKRYLGGYFEKSNYPEYYHNIPIEGRLRSKVRKNLFIKQAKIEKETLRNCNHVIIDNDFSEAYCKFVSPSINCYYRVLEPNSIFRSFHWSFDKIKKHQIFTVYGGSAEKGVHQLLFAVGMLKKKYPDIKVMIPGNYNLSSNNKLVPGKSNAYETILFNIIDKLGLLGNVCFTGRLSPQEMAFNISSSHIFVNPSCMEVHALSLREAMIMGVPSITSLCGSTGSYVNNEVNGLIYRFEEFEVLAYYIDKLFSCDSVCENLSKNAVESLSSYQKEKKSSLIEIYNKILEGKN